MTRDDSLLYTGATSASNREQVIREKRDKSIEKRANLLPAGEIVKAELQKEIDAVRNIEYLDIESMLTDEHFKSELMARKKFLERLIALKNKFDNLLRDNKR